MNYLTQAFPQAVRVAGKVYQLNTDFRVGLKVMLAFEDSHLTEFEKQVVMVGLLFSQPPVDFGAAVEAAVKFLNCGEPSTNDNGQRIYSFQKDAAFIYSAILQTHHVDLQTVEYLHWWKFCAMFYDLREDCLFQRLVSLRKRKNEGRLTKEEQRVWYDMKDILELEEPDPEREKANEEFNRRMQLG